MPTLSQKGYFAHFAADVTPIQRRKPQLVNAADGLNRS
jgi:hypothetical protein